MSSLKPGKLYQVTKRTLVSVRTPDGQGHAAFMLDRGDVVMVTNVNNEFKFVSCISLLIKMKVYRVDIKTDFESTYFEEIL